MLACPLPRPHRLTLAVGLAISTGSLQAATITVNTHTDAPPEASGHCTLRDAVLSANTGTSYGDCLTGSAGADEIVFDSALAGSTVELEYGEITITNSLTIAGLGAGDITIDAGGNSRHFNVDFDEHNEQVLEISGITLANGQSSGDGGSIRMAVPFGESGYRAELVLEETVLTGNYAAGDGGAVYFSTHECGGLSVRDSDISNNQALYAGGGIFFYPWQSCSLEVTEGSVISDNATLSGDGGGIAVYTTYVTEMNSPPHPEITLSEATLSGNDAARGGAFMLGLATTASLLVEDSEISGNTAEDGGGGFLLTAFSHREDWDQDLHVTISDTAFTDNEATVDIGAFALIGVLMDENPYEVILRMEESLISGNQADESVGGVFLYAGQIDAVISDTVFANNAAYNNDSGALRVTNLIFNDVDPGSFQIERSVFRDNSAYVIGTARFDMEADFEIRDSEFSGNYALSGLAGPFVYFLSDGSSSLFENVTISGNHTPDDFGGFTLMGPGDAVFSHVTLTGNSADEHAGLVTLTDVNCVVVNSLLWDNATIGGDRTDLDSDCDVAYSLIGDSEGSVYFDSGDNITDVDPVIGPLAFNNTTGLTRTHALLTGSPAVGAGADDFDGIIALPNHDQRGAPFVRQYGTAPDLGAYEAHPIAAFAAEAVEFGEVSVGDGTDESIELQNPGAFDVDIMTAGPITGPDAGVFSINTDACSNQTIAAGGDCTISVIFEPDARRPFEAELPVEFDANGSPASILLQGTGIGPSVTRMPFLLDFGTVQVNDSAGPLVLTIESIGEEPLQVDGLLGLQPPFELMPGGNCGAFPFTLDPGQFCTLEFGFSPTEAGVFSNGIVFDSDAIDGEEAFVLFGMGQGDVIFEDRFEE